MTDRYQSLVPRPVAAHSEAGTYELTRDTPLVAAPGSAAAAEVVRLLLAPLRLPLPPASSGMGLVVRIDPGVTGPEAYRLRVTGDGVELSASTVDGIRHATQTLRQLLPDAAWRSTAPPGTRWIVPCGEVTDAPALSWRGGMLDVSRHFFAKDTLLRYVDLFAMHRLNRLHLHLTDDQGWRIESRRHPRLHEVGGHRPATQAWYDRKAGRTDGTPHGGYYTLDDLAEIAAYAAERGITLVPEIDLPGHASALLAAYPELGVRQHNVSVGWGISDAVVRPVPATIRFLTEVLEELTDALPGPYVHLGGDECLLQDWVTDKETSEYMGSLGYTDPVDLFGHFLRELAGHLSSRGRRAVMWDEGYVGGGVLPDSVVTAWRGDGVARRAAAAGYGVVRCPVYPTYFDYDQSDGPDEPLSIGGPVTLPDVAAFEPVPDGWSDEERANVIGAQFQAWAEYIPDARHLDYMVFPRAAVFADVAWSGRPVDDYEARLAGHLRRLDAAGCAYRPLSGPLPWQAGGTGDRRRADGTPIARVREHLEKLSAQADVPSSLVSM
ncbi:beta-N-acetylhexosaminidase [Phytohabitans rumicis]|uniref:beta-N-acetylhexosaminidase n=1 Tax=Phytohabitans rumicis TaxID=1076125 RepID=A0A6V8L303_9ACTN|nr:beta-N-acetylhexosaminidase [Phytohabitans rumicis]GFJ91653.1 beta-N-acetylhexosaminidase [Phytohabitans rumicis]